MVMMQLYQSQKYQNSPAQQNNNKKKIAKRERERVF